MGLGAMIVAPSGERYVVSHPALEIGCNNEAELRALIAALELAQASGADSTAQLHLFCDSRVVVDQLAPAVNGKASRPIARLAELFETARVLIEQFHTVSLQWIPQVRNAEADALARAALGITALRVPHRPKHRTSKRRG
jgi:ribonuclease HI